MHLPRGIALVALASLASACVATFPPGPSAENEALVLAHEPCGPCVIVAEPSIKDREEFAEALEKTGLFSQVTVADTAERAEAGVWLIGMAPEPHLSPGGHWTPGQAVTVITLGIVPHIGTGYAIRGFTLERSGEPDGRALVKVGGEVTTVTGWLGLPLLLMPWWFAPAGTSARTRLDAWNFAAAVCRGGVARWRAAALTASVALTGTSSPQSPRAA